MHSFLAITRPGSEQCTKACCCHVDKHSWCACRRDDLPYASMDRHPNDTCHSPSHVFWCQHMYLGADSFTPNLDLCRARCDCTYCGDCTWFLSKKYLVCACCHLCHQHLCGQHHPLPLNGASALRSRSRSNGQFRSASTYHGVCSHHTQLQFG